MANEAHFFVQWPSMNCCITRQTLDQTLHIQQPVIRRHWRLSWSKSALVYDDVLCITFRLLFTAMLLMISRRLSMKTIQKCVMHTKLRTRATPINIITVDKKYKNE